MHKVIDEELESNESATVFKVYLFNAKLDATTLVQKHKVVALRGNGTLRADPRVSSSAEDVARGFFSFSSILFHYQTGDRGPARTVKRTRRKRFGV